MAGGPSLTALSLSNEEAEAPRGLGEHQREGRALRPSRACDTGGCATPLSRQVTGPHQVSDSAWPFTTAHGSRQQTCLTQGNITPQHNMLNFSLIFFFL